MQTKPPSPEQTQHEPQRPPLDEPLVQRLAAGSAVAEPLLSTIQRGTLAYSYKGISTLKNPFDFALYPMLLWEARPATIIEVGSNRGGSALWLADTIRAFSLSCHVHSVDIRAVTGLTIPGVTFHAGDARNLGASFSPEFMERLQRPLLVIEDSDHQKSTVLAVLRFFHRWLRRGEYIVVEDGIVADMGLAERFAGGPTAAIKEFLSEFPADYAVDVRYCDFFGRNVTWNVNGYLRRVK